MLSIAAAAAAPAAWDLARGTGLSENMMDLVWLVLCEAPVGLHLEYRSWRYRQGSDKHRSGN